MLVSLSEQDKKKPGLSYSEADVLQHGVGKMAAQLIAVVYLRKRETEKKWGGGGESWGGRREKKK